MAKTTTVTLALHDADGRQVGRLQLNLLPGRADPKPGGLDPLVDLQADPTRDQSLEPVQLLEGAEYRYILDVDGPAPPELRLEPAEHIFPDDSTGRTGRLRTRLSTGMLPLTVLVGDRELGRTAVEVRSRKLGYLDQYQWMLRDVADEMAELLMERFAPAQQRFQPDPNVGAETLYQRFALLQSLFAGPDFEVAVQQVLAYPHRQWRSSEEPRRPGQPLPASGATIRRLVGPGPRVRSGEAGRHLPLDSLPAHLLVIRTEESLDTPENRFVKHIFTIWRAFVTDVQRALLAERPAAPVRRGLRAVAAALERLEEVLAADLFHNIGPLTAIPSSSQVLQKRAGYRELYRADLQFESAALLTWAGGDDVYAAGKRDVATLYEYWVFLQILRMVETLCGQTLDRSHLLEFGAGRMNVAFCRGREHAFHGSIERLGRRLRVELCFNRAFPAGEQAPSWTREMRPDISLLIEPQDVYGRADPVWLHFDAKYRADQITDLFGDEAGEEADGDRGRSEAKREDLLKMHAYRDAIRRSVGAYVLYPGTERALRKPYQELLPGLGAFFLRPSLDGAAAGADLLATFIDDVITHVATQASQHERVRFWVDAATRPDELAASSQAVAVPFLTRPPADTLVLLGYVKTPGQKGWIARERRYNLRADPGRSGSVSLNARELAAELVLLYDRGGEWFELWTVRGEPELREEAEMARQGYPDPKGPYLCLPLGERLRASALGDVPPTDLDAAYHMRDGGPVVMIWAELLRRLPV